MAAVYPSPKDSVEARAPSVCVPTGAAVAAPALVSHLLDTSAVGFVFKRTAGTELITPSGNYAVRHLHVPALRDVPRERSESPTPIDVGTPRERLIDRDLD